MIPSEPPEDLDAGWDADDDDDESGGATRIVDAREALMRAWQSKTARSTAQMPAQVPAAEGSHTRPASDTRQTEPPPMPEEEYVERMMRQAPASYANLHAVRGRLDTITEDDPLRFDISKPLTTLPPPQIPTPVPPSEDAMPQTSPPPTRPVELQALDLPLFEDLAEDLDLPPSTSPAPDLIAHHRDAFRSSTPPPLAPTPVPDGPPEIEINALDTLDLDEPIATELEGDSLQPLEVSGFDSLDDLPFDDVLAAVSRRPDDLEVEGVASAPSEPPIPPPPPRRPPPRNLSPAGLRLNLKLDKPLSEPPVLESIPPESSEPEHDDARATIPGEAPPEPARQRTKESLTHMRALARQHVGAARGPSDPLDEQVEEMLALFEAGSYNTALDLAEGILREGGNPVAQRCVEACQELLLETYLRRLGDRGATLRVLVDPNEVRDLGLDHRAGFLLSFIDGQMSLEEVLDCASMPHLDAVRMLCELKSRGVIAADPPAASSRK
jgi:hypothetical protein